MNLTNIELDQWQRVWQARAEGPPVADLRDRVARETRLRRVLLVAPVLTTVVIGGAMIAWAIASPTLERIALALEAWGFAAVVWGVAIWIDRGSWRPLGDTTAAFVDISIRRCRSDISGLRVAVVLYIIQFIAILTLKYSLSSVRPLEILTAWPVIVIGWLGFPLLLTFVVWYGRRKRRELDHFLALRGQLTAE